MYSVKKHPQLESTMFDEEIDVLESVLRDALDGFSGNGAYILTSQRNSSPVQERILSFCVGKNKQAAKEEKESLELAIKEMLPAYKGESCIKWVNNQPILILNASYGRFICGFFAADPDFSVGILATTAEALSRLSSNDGALRGSCREISWHEYADELPLVFKRVTELFDIHKTPAIKRWGKWKRFATKDLFFV